VPSSWGKHFVRPDAFLAASHESLFSRVWHDEDLEDQPGFVGCVGSHAMDRSPGRD
jgi:hypothetical protein